MICRWAHTWSLSALVPTLMAMLSLPSAFWFWPVTFVAMDEQSDDAQLHVPTAPSNAWVSVI